MSFFNRVLASIGIGAAKVDTKLEKDTYQIGETVRGVVHLQGGQVEQQVDNIYLNLMTQIVREVDDKKVRENRVLDSYKVTEPVLLKVNEKKEIPFSFTLPYETPITAGRTTVWIKTGVDIKSAVDPTDNDYIKVMPNPIIRTVLDAVAHLGFQLREVECEYSPRMRQHFPVVQEFEFVPRTNFRGSLDELEMVFLARPDQVEVLMEIDKKARGLFGMLEEAMNLDERYVRLRFTQADVQGGVQSVANTLTNIINSKI